MTIFWYMNIISMLLYVILFYVRFKKPHVISQNVLFALLVVAIVTYFLNDGPYPLARAIAFFFLLLFDLSMLLVLKPTKNKKK